MMTACARILADPACLHGDNIGGRFAEGGFGGTIHAALTLLVPRREPISRVAAGLLALDTLSHGCWPLTDQVTNRL